jgi:hypothetical protein
MSMSATDRAEKEYRRVAVIPLENGLTSDGVPFATSDGGQYLATCICPLCYSGLEEAGIIADYPPSLPLYVTDETGQRWTFFTLGWHLIAEAHLRPGFEITPLFDADRMTDEISALFKALREF